MAHLEEIARRAHYWTSFSPDVRGKQIVEAYSAELLEDMETVKKYGRDPETYRQRYERKLIEWLNSKGRTASAAVTGPSNFPTARNQKRLNAEHNKLEAFRNWREIVLSAYKKDAERRRRAVYEITGKNKFKTVMLDGSQLCTDERVRPIGEKFGIGTYYTEGDKISPEQVAQLVEVATKATEERNAAARKAREAQEEEKRATIAKGAQIVSEVPKWAKAVIIASFHEDQSDMHSDYFNHTVSRTVFIEFKASTRNDMEELRAAAAKFEETADLATADKEHEHREMYSMGAGFYLGTYKHNTGWKVSKVPLTSYRATLEAMQIAAGRGDFLIDTSAPEPEGAQTGTEGISVKLNEKMRGVEIRFTGKPSEETLSAIKSAGGWRWSKFQKMWYAGDTERTRTFAYGLAGLPVPGKE